nr:centrosomal protein of 290 kDa [Danaus plexippus plexippus]
MAMDWREILRFSEKELRESEKDKLCEGLSWMEVDDIELNFTDLKILFKVAQDVLKYKNEQVNSAMDKLNKTKRKIRTKERGTLTESPAKSSDSVLETIEHQEEIIKANKYILEQLYIDIAELEGRKNKHEKDNDFEHESNSSRATLSEMNAIATLENELSKKNRHIRKLLTDVKILEEENATLKEKLIVFKDKLKESTLLIENLTEQLFNLNNENSNIKDSLGKAEEEKANMLVEIETLNSEIKNKRNKTERNDEDIKLKLQHFKNLAKTQKQEITQKIKENNQLKEKLERISKCLSSPKELTKKQDDSKNIELQEKLTEASQQMMKSANIIQSLKEENRRLKIMIEDIPEHSISEQKNESDDGKERNLINKLKRKIKCLNIALQGSEEMLAVREKEITEITAQLQLLRSDEGINALIDSIKDKKKHLRVRDEGIKSLVQEVNKLNDVINELQLENEAMREKLNLPDNTKIETHGIMKRYKDIETQNIELHKKVRDYEDRLINIELDNREKKAKRSKAKSIAITQTCDEIREHDRLSKEANISEENLNINDILEENEGLRNGLTDILNLLKDNRSTAGVLLLECPSLEALLNSMEARKASGWFSPHMKTVMELKAALGGKDALLSALHESRQETFDVLKKLEIEKQRYSDLEEKIKENNNIDKVNETGVDLNKFGSWMTDDDFKNIDINNTKQVAGLIDTGNALFENDLKQTLRYFQEKFCQLFDNFTSLSISASDDSSKWNIQEEKYKAEIENLKSHIDEHEDDSNLSPGLLTITNDNIERKYTYLEDLYKKMRTDKENIKNEYLELKRERLIETSEYERKIQNLLLSVLNLTDRLRNTVPLEVFFKQREDHNKFIIKYRNVLETNISRAIGNEELLQHLDDIKMDILNRFYKEGDQKVTPVKIEEVEQNIYQEQLKKLIIEVTEKNNEIEKLRNTISELQLAESQLTDKILNCDSNQFDYYKNEIEKRNEENHMMKEKYQDTKTELDKIYLELQSYKHKELANDIEINMLRHQILDLQSSGDNKAIIARLSGEVLLAQLQVTESYEKIDSLKIALNNEKQLRAETEDVLMSRQKVFEIYSKRNDNKLRNMSQLIDTMRELYQGHLPLVSVETFLHKLEDIKLKSNEVNEKLNDINDLQTNLLTKYSIYNNILELLEKKCPDNDTCSHKLKNMITENMQKRETELCKKKLVSADEAYKSVLERCDYLEKTLISVNQGFKVVEDVDKNATRVADCNNDLKVENVPSEDEMSSISSCSRKSRTFTLSPPKVTNEGKTCTSVIANNEPKKLLHEQTQTNFTHMKKTSITQTDDDQYVNDLKTKLNNSILRGNEKDKIIEEIEAIAQQKDRDMAIMTKKCLEQEKAYDLLSNINIQKDDLIKNLQETIQTLKNDIADVKSTHIKQINRIRETADVENKMVTDTLKKIEVDKNNVIAEYKDLLDKEREEYSKTVKGLQGKARELQMKLDQRDSTATRRLLRYVLTNKYYNRISDLETKIFKVQSDFEGSQAELVSQKSELERWKILASERLTKMEQLSTQLKERHNDEMESYKAENRHWLSQLSETQREHMELRHRLSEQKTLHLRQIADKDALIDRLRTVVNNLKSQILNMQTMLTVNDPSFDLSAIVEVDEVSEVVSQQGSDRLELKFESTVDLTETEDELKMPSSSTAIWQEPLIDRLRREKQMIHKQNLALRRQVKVLVARERRARLDSQNLKNQVFRISTSGAKTPSVESRALQSKVASLQAQLAGVRRDAATSLALWDKWKRAQQASDRWQMRYEEKCQENNKLDMSLNLMKSAVARLEKEKRVLLLRLSETKQEAQLSIEKQDSECPEKALVPCSVLPVSSRALVERVEAQQRRIVALELAEKVSYCLVSKLQAEKCSSTNIRKNESRPSSGQRSDKVRIQAECYRTEISNLKRTILEKDSLLERSRDMLRVAAEREEHLLRENTQLRHRLEQLTEIKDGRRSA